MPMIQSFSPILLDYYECTIGIIFYTRKVPTSIMLGVQVMT